MICLAHRKFSCISTSVMSAMRPAHEQILYLYLLCSRHLLFMYSLVLCESAKCQNESIFKGFLFNFHYLLAAFEDILKKYKIHLSKSIVFLLDRETETCLQFFKSSQQHSSLSSCSHQILSTHSWGLHGEFILQYAHVL